jgi:hypothetical protein
MAADFLDGSIDEVEVLQVPAQLADFAERFLAGSGLSVEDAVRVARGELDAPPELIGLQDALRAGWHSAQNVS